MDEMDEVAQYNIARWNSLVEADALFTRPAINLDAAAARQMVDRQGQLGEVAGKQVLCLAGGGGQQSVAFALLGAQVTVFDLSAAQLERDAAAAAHYGAEIQRAITMVQGDMRDLSRFADDSFDLVYHAYSLGFVPDAAVVFGEVARVLRPGGIYHFNCANPFVVGLTQDDWNGEGYTLKHPYVAGAAISYADQPWVYERTRPNMHTDNHPDKYTVREISGPREYRHTLSALVNGLAANGFVIVHLSDAASFDPDPDAEPGTWSHFVSIAPPWLAFWARYRPELLGKPLR
jgi:ubiquinone/menaquinone biosynthesis C-methylase UbiE